LYPVAISPQGVPFGHNGESLQKKHLAITITIYMDKTYDMRGTPQGGNPKIGGDKIALLGLFIVAMLIARLIVASKSALILSEPIKLAYAGLSVSMPAGNGWKTEKRWRYREDTFSLSSSFAIGSNRPTAWANCRYFLVAETATPQMRFEQKAFELEGRIAKIDQTKTDTLIFDWALIEKPQTPLSFIFGTAKLPHNRQLDIEVHQIMSDAGMAERTFKRIVKTLSFKDNQLLKVVSEIETQKDRTATENRIRKFPERAEYIRRQASLSGLRTNKILKYDKEPV